MNFPISLALLPYLFFTEFAIAGPAQSHIPKCGDFLRRSYKVPQEIRYISCTNGKSAQIEILVATYRVSGENAKAAEKFLMKAMGMATLRFACCGWEPAAGKSGSYQDARGYLHSVQMTSGETLEKNWRKIREFIISDELLLTEP